MSDKTRVCIGIITRERPEMLAQLIDSVSELLLPECTGISIAIVENNPNATLEPLVKRLRDKGHEVFYELEPRLGIPFARNRVLDISLREGFDYTTFVDDDEVVAPTWLRELIKRAESGNLDLVGGPVQPVFPRTLNTARLYGVIGGLSRQARRKQMRAQKHFEGGTDQKVTIVTNNWMVRNDFLKSSAVRFDETMGLSCGSDTRFFMYAKKAGAKSGWAPKALVMETLPESRLRYGYQFRRARNQSIASYLTKVESRKPATFLRSFGFCTWKVLVAVAMLAVAVPTRGVTVLDSVRALAFAAGRIQAVAGRNSQFYSRTDGY